jgi:hypothetical protein
MSIKSAIEVGDPVIVRFGPRLLVAHVIEDRGQLGREADRILRVGWTPAETDERFEVEVPESAVVRAFPDEEYPRALARIDEWSVRSDILGGSADGALARVQSARTYLDRAVRAAEERGSRKDFELVHRYCVETVGPAALHARRLWTERSSAQHVNPTLNRLPAMVAEAGVSDKWINAPKPLAEWHQLVSGELDKLATLRIEDASTGEILVRTVGYCAEMAAWIRMAYGVGD